MEPFFILNNLKIYLPLLILLFILIHKIKTNELKIVWIKYGIISIVTILFSISSYLTIATYSLWRTDQFSKFLLPPYHATYFYGYAFSNFWLSFFIIIIVSVFWTAFLFLVKKYSRNRLLDKNEVYLGLFTALAVGFPNFIPYVFILLILFLLQHIINFVILKNKNPIIITHSMIISAIIVILWRSEILIKFGLTALKI